jgi:hemerythrin superfamily protein
MADVFEILRQDHEEVESMLARLEARPADAVPVGDSQLEERKKLTEQVIIAASGHEAVEEQYFWPAVRDLGPEGEQVAAKAVGQEQDAKQVLAQLDKLDPAEAQFERLLTRFTEDTRTHIAFEEGHAWPMLRAALTPAQASDLGEKIATAKKAAPTRPHPHTPASEGLLKTAGPVIAAADKLRDAATGRGDN